MRIKLHLLEIIGICQQIQKENTAIQDIHATVFSKHNGNRIEWTFCLFPLKAYVNIDNSYDRTEVHLTDLDSEILDALINKMKMIERSLQWQLLPAETVLKNKL